MNIQEHLARSEHSGEDKEKEELPEKALQTDITCEEFIPPGETFHCGNNCSQVFNKDTDLASELGK